MHEEYYDKIADLLLFGVGFRPDDKIALSADVYYRDLARVLSERAYRGGARYVDLSYTDEFMQAAAVAGSAPEFWFPDFTRARYEEITQPGWKSIAIRSNSEGEVFAGLPVERTTAYLQAYRRNRRVRQEAIMAHKIPWTLTYLPSPSMAQLAFPGLEVDAAMANYWKAVIDIMYLDHEDPRKVWEEKMEESERRSRYLNELKPHALRFEGPGTELTVGLNPRARWVGGFDRSATGEPFIANIPTEEIFTSPDCRTLEGRVRLTRPFRMHQNLGPIPEEAWVEFHEGRVVDFGAERGAETLAAFFESDERAVYAGEIALVDPRSPIAQTGITYYNGLHDENTSCHLAFGQSYVSTLIDQHDYTEEELLAMGMNVANVHEDTMIGGPEVDVTAILDGEGSEPLIRDGRMLV